MKNDYGNSANGTDLQEFVISEYLNLLTPTEQKSKYICPICEGHNLSIHKNGKKYSCFDGCTGNQIAYKLRELNGEFNKLKDKDLLQVYNNDNTKVKPRQKNTESSDNKYNTAPKVLSFLRERFGGRIAYNVRSNLVEIDDVPFSMDCARAWIADKFGVDIIGELLRECLLHLSKSNQYDPVKRYLERCKHLVNNPLDLSTLAQSLFYRSEKLYGQYFKNWLIGCVARVYDPGCKFDEALVLQGQQGTFKTTFFREMAVDWFDNSMTGKLDKDDLILLSKAWIIEWGELDGFTAKTYHGTIKHFLSRQEDNFRPPYGRDSQCIPRRSVIVGTTNRLDFLNDPTSNRRFWVIPLEKSVNMQLVQSLREQIWGSAVIAYENGEKWELSQDFKNAQAEDNTQYEQHDPWEDIILSYLETQYNEHAQKYLPVTAKELLDKLEEANCKINRTKSDEMRVADILRREGWTRKREREGQTRVYRWRKE